MAKEGTCNICGKYGRVTEHHKIRKSKKIALKKCKKNLTDLCDECHYSIHHGKNGHALDQKLKLEFQNFLEFIFDKQEFTIDEIRESLEITESAAYMLCKQLIPIKGKYKREDIIFSAMGERLIEESEVEYESTSNY